ncbi:MAG: peptidylprolyl isomerase [Bacteroidota bacterium]
MPDSTRCTIVKEILESKILLLQAAKDSVTVSDEEVEAELKQRLGNFELPGNTRREAFNQIKEYRLTNLMQEKIVSNVKITPSEVKSFYQSTPVNQLPFFEPQYEIGHIVIYPRATPEMEKYLLTEMNHYKQMVGSKQTSFQKLALSVSEDKAVKENEGVYHFNRNTKEADPLLITTVFQLKDGDISSPIKIKGGYCLVQMMERDGDEATVAMIFRSTPIAEAEIKKTIFDLNTVRAEIKLGETSFEQAAKKHSELRQAAFSAFIQGGNGEPFVTMDELDKNVAKEVLNLKAGEITEAKVFMDEEGKTGVRILYLKSKTESHRMNLTNDYSRIAELALDEKKRAALASWFKVRIPDLSIMIEEDVLSECPKLREYSSN